MSKNTNLLLNVASLSMKVAGRCLIPYGHPKSPHKFTQRQLMTCLVLRAYTKSTYRGVIELLEASGQLRRVLCMERLPHYSTLKKFADRTVIPEILEFLLEEILREVGEAGEEVAMDSTGLETSSASAHYVSRSGRDRKQYVKVSASVTCKSMLAAGLVVGWGPGNDKAEARWLLTETAKKLRPKYLYADAGYDAEWVHAYCREKWGVRSYIPPAVHRRDGGVNGRYRSQMTRLPKRYGRRWHVESFFSGLKRTMGSQLNARTQRGLFAEAAIRVLAYTLRR